MPKHSANKFSAFWITELATGELQDKRSLFISLTSSLIKQLDIAVLACTLVRSYQVYWKSSTRNNRLWKIILKDGRTKLALV